MRAIRLFVAGAVLCVVGAAVPATAQVSGLDVTTPFPSVAVSPGDVVTFQILVDAPGRQRVDLSVASLPAGWDALLRGGGFVVGGVYTDPSQPPEVELEVSVPDSAKPGVHRVLVEGSSAVGSDELVLDLRVSRLEAGQVSLAAEFPQLQGSADATYSFDVELSNDTPRETVFQLEGAGPPGWQVTVKPAGQEQASSVEVAPGEATSLTVEVDPADQAGAGAYPIGVRASGGGATAETELAVRIVGTFTLTVTTPDERLNATVSAGEPTQVPIVIRNDGSAPLRDVELRATPPSGWDVTFRPGSIPEIPPGETARAFAVVTAADEAVAGDYVVTITAQTAETSHQIDLRTTVRTSLAWGVVGGGLIAAALVGLGLVFRRFGRR
jgi:uncharacterized membrane protein